MKDPASLCRSAAARHVKPDALNTRHGQLINNADATANDDAGLALRSLLQTHLWWFGAPPYRTFKDRQSVNAARLVPPPQTIAYPAQGGRREFDCAIAQSESHCQSIAACNRTRRS
jgi:hypothetical protein